MSEMRRLWVDRSIYDDHSVLVEWLTAQGLSRFFVEVSRDDNEDRVLIDVHALPDEPISLVPRHDPLSSNKRCEDLDCPLCVTVARPSGAIPAYSTDAFRQLASDDEDTQLSLPPAGTVGWLPIRPEQFGREDTNPKWPTALRIGEQTDPIPRVRVPVSPVAIAIWVASIALAILAAFVCVRLWYVRYGCPFWPDSGLLGACRALIIHAVK